MPTNRPDPVGVPDEFPDGPAERVPDKDALVMARDFPDIYAQGQHARREGLTFWEACWYNGSWYRYAFQAGWERPDGEMT